MDDSQWTWRVAWVVSLALIWLTWSGGLDVPFVYDDRVEVFPLQGRSWSELHEWADYNPSRPLVVLSYLYDFERADGVADPRVFHWTSWWLHLLACGSALFMAESLGRLSGRTRAGFMGAIAVLLWSVHPMASEAVLYISARSELLCGFFMFLSIGCWGTALRLEREDTESWQSALSWRVGAILACAAAIASKETGLVGPLALIALEMGLGGDSEQRWWKRIRWHYWAPLLALVVFGVGLRLQRILQGDAAGMEEGLFSGMGTWSALLPAEVERDLGVQLTTSAQVWQRYAGLWLLPIGQTIRHGQVDLSPGSAGGLLAIAVWFGMLYGGWRLWRHNRVAGLALLFGGLSLIPSTSFVPLNEHMAEHRAYQLGLFLLLGMAWSIPRSVFRYVPWAGGGVLVALVVASQARVEVWLSETGLWLESGERVEAGEEERSEIAKRAFQTGTVMRLEGENADAAAQLLRAIEYGDSADRVWLEDGEHGLLYASWNELGILRASEGDGVGAQEAFEAAIRVDPSACRAQNNLAGLQFNQGKIDLARRIYMDSLGYCPDDAVALFMLGRMHYEAWKMSQQAGDPVGRQDVLRDQAQEFFQRLEKVHPRFAQIEQVKRWLLELTFHQ